MTAKINALSQDALALPPDERMALAHRLLLSVESDPEPGAEAAWEREIVRRITRFDAGETSTVPAGQFFERLHKIAPCR